MSKKAKLITLFVIMLILAGVLVITSLQRQNEPDEIMNKSIVINDYSLSELESITLMPKDEKSVIFVRDESYLWVVKGEENNYELIQNNIDMLAYSMISLNAISLVEENATDNLQQYGLDNPSVILGGLTDGTELKISCGNKTPTGNSYYAMVERNNSIYEIYTSYADVFLSSFIEYRVRDIIQAVNAEDITYLAITKPNAETIVIAKTDNEETNSPIINFSNHQLTEPLKSNHDISIEKLRLLVENLNSLTQAKDFIDMKDVSIAEYGLEKSHIKITIVDSNQEKILLLGDDIANSNLVYCMIEGDKTIYAVDKEYVEYFTTLQPMDLILRFLLLVNIDAVDKVVVTKASYEYTMEITREITNDDADKDGEPDAFETYYINKMQVDEDSFKETYQLAVGMLVDGIAEDQTNIEDSEITIEYINNIDGAKNDTISFAEYNDYFYSVYCNGVNEFVVSKDEVDKLLVALDSFG